MTQEPVKKSRLKFSLDAWAVWVALSLVLLVRLGVINKIPW